MVYKIPLLPLQIELETKGVLKKLAASHQALAELKGICGIIPNQTILINTPSQDESQIRLLMNNLEQFINDDNLSDLRSPY